MFRRFTIWIACKTPSTGSCSAQSGFILIQFELILCANRLTWNGVTKKPMGRFGSNFVSLLMKMHRQTYRSDSLNTLNTLLKSYYRCLLNIDFYFNWLRCGSTGTPSWVWSRHSLSRVSLVYVSNRINLLIILSHQCKYSYDNGLSPQCQELATPLSKCKVFIICINTTAGYFKFYPITSLWWR